MELDETAAREALAARGVTGEAQDEAIEQARATAAELASHRTPLVLEVAARLLAGAPPFPLPDGTTLRFVAESAEDASARRIDAEFSDGSSLELALEQTGWVGNLAPLVTPVPAEAPARYAGEPLEPVDVDVIVKLPVRVQLPAQTMAELDDPTDHVVAMVKRVAQEQHMMFFQWLMQHGGMYPIAADHSGREKGTYVELVPRPSTH